MATDVASGRLSSRLINREIPSPAGALALCGCFVGACLVSTNAIDAVEPGDAPLYAIALNLIGPAFQGIVVALFKEERHARDRRREYIVRRVYLPQALLQCPRRVPGGATVEGVAAVATVHLETARFAISTLLVSGVQLVLHRAGDPDVVDERRRRGHVQGHTAVAPGVRRERDEPEPPAFGDAPPAHLVGVVLAVSLALLWAYSGGAHARRDTAARVLAEVFDAATPPGSPSRAPSPHSPAILRLGSFPRLRRLLCSSCLLNSDVVLSLLARSAAGAGAQLWSASCDRRSQNAIDPSHALPQRLRRRAGRAIELRGSHGRGKGSGAGPGPRAGGDGTGRRRRHGPGRRAALDRVHREDLQRSCFFAKEGRAGHRRRGRGGRHGPERANALMRLYAGHALSRLDDDVKAKVWRRGFH